MRNPEDSGRAWAESKGLSITVKPPAACAPDELQGFRTMVLREWQVSDEGLDERIARAKVLVMVYAPDGTLVAIGAAKKPARDYAQGVFERAGVEGYANFTYEIGYEYVLPEYRSHLLSRLVTETLIDACGDVAVFGTTRTDNERMQRTLRRLGFKQVGHEYPSERGPYNLYLYTRETQP